MAAFIDIPKELQRDPFGAMEYAKCAKQFYKTPLTLPGGQTVPDQMAMIDDAGRYLGVVGKDYEPVQPEVVAGMAQELIGHSEARLVKIINLHDGATVGLNFTIRTVEPVPGDATDFNFLMLNNASGRLSLQGRSISHRWFCSNQIATSTKMFSLKHTRYVADRVKTALMMLKYYDHEAQAFQANLQRLVRFRHGTVKDQLDWFERTLLPAPKEDDSQKVLSRRANILATIADLLERGSGVEYLGSARGSGWHTLNALTEYVNHHRSTRVTEGRDETEVRWETVTLGAGDKLMQYGFNDLLKLAR